MGEGEGERSIVNGAHNTDVFQTLLDKFIDKYVLCEGCKLPEIDMMVKKGDTIFGKCKACGWSGELDNCHKVAKEIIKSPPEGVGFDGKGGEKMDRKARQAARAAKAAKKKDGEDDS